MAPLPTYLEARGSVVPAPLTADNVPLDAALVRSHISADGLDDASTTRLLAAYTLAAVAWAERVTNRAIAARQHTWRFGRLPPCAGALKLPRGRATSIESIVVETPDGVVTLSGPTSPRPGADYTEDLTLTTGAILRPTADWPTLAPNGRTTITFSAGYDAQSLPADLQHALLFAVADAYEMRSEVHVEPGRAQFTRHRLLAGHVLPRAYAALAEETY